MTTPEPQSGQQKARIDPHAKNPGRERDTIDRNDQDQQRRMGSARGHATRIDYLARPGSDSQRTRNTGSSGRNDH